MSIKDYLESDDNNNIDEDDRSLKGFSINLDALPSKRLEIS